MEHHGSESYFVLGEGLLGESLGGRDGHWRPVEAAVPPFRFSRMGPKGTGKQLGEPNRRKLAEAMTVDNLTAGSMPAGFTYLGQFIDHDLTFDKTALMEGVDVPPGEIEQSRSPSLDLDSLYGAGPQDPGLGQVLQRRPAPEDGQRGRGPPSKGFDLPRKGSGAPAARGDHPRSPQRREPRRRADAPGVHPVPQPRGRHAPVLGPAGAAVHRGAQDRHEALPVDDPNRLPAAPLRCGRGQRRLLERPAGLRGQGRADVRADDADRVLRRGLPARPQHGAGRVQLEQELPERNARTAVRLLRSSAAISVAAPGSRASGSPTSAGSTTSARPVGKTSSSRRRSSTGRCASTRSSSTRCATFGSTRSDPEKKPRLPEPDQGEHGQARHRPADGRRS